MSISGLFIRRPVATTLVMFGMLMFGLIETRIFENASGEKEMERHNHAAEKEDAADQALQS